MQSPTKSGAPSKQKQQTATKFPLTQRSEKKVTNQLDTLKSQQRIKLPQVGAKLQVKQSFVSSGRKKTTGNLKGSFTTDGVHSLDQFSPSLHQTSYQMVDDLLFGS